MPIDFARAFRSLCRNPGFFAVATVTLAVGLGPTTAVFSVFEALVLWTIPVDRPEELAVLGPGAVGMFSRSDVPQTETFSFAQYMALREDNNGVFDAVAAAPTTDSRVYWGRASAPGSEPLRASCFLVTGTYFPMLGVRPYLGRLLDPRDDTVPGANPVVVVSHAFWASRLGAATDAVGSTIRLQGTPYTIVGIAEESFRGHTLEIPVDMWVPMSMQREVTLSPSRLERSHPIETYWLNILVRLQDGVSLQRAEAAVNARLQQIFLEHSGEGISAERREELERIWIPLTPAGRGLSRIRQSAQGPVTLLWIATGLVLLVACANLGSLLLVRASARRNEFRVRLALGASRLDLMRPVLAESMILAGSGTAAGCALAYWLVPTISRWLQEVRGAGALEAEVSHLQLLFAAVAGVLTVLASGLVPAVLTAKGSAYSASQVLRAGVTPGRDETRARGVLVACQVALAVVLLTAAGLSLRTLSELSATELGVEAERVIGLSLDPRGGGFSPATQPSMRRRILERVEGLPGVEAAAFTGSLPLRGNVGMRTIEVSGYTPGQGEFMAVIHVWASSGYFETLGIRLLEGRFPRRGESNAVVVNRAFAERFFPGRSALGGIINRTDRIVGVVNDVRQVNVRDEPPPLLYQSTERYEGFLQTLAVRVSAPIGATALSARDAVLDVVPGMPVEREFASVQLHLQRGIALERMLARLAGAFALVALLLCTVGLFGVCSQMVRGRRGEIGIRMALGATRGQVQLLVFRRAGALLVIGVSAGIAAAVAAGRVMASLLYVVGPFDWTVVGLALAALMACASPAVAVPALRAGRISPAAALRHE